MTRAGLVSKCFSGYRRIPCKRNASSTGKSGSRKVIFSGIQPTGIPHIGNYLGALRNWVKMQNSAQQDDQLIFSVVGWHALTLPQDPRKLLQARNDTFATLLAIGLNPERCIIFHQDQNVDHVELAWLLNCITPFGKLRRMTTWKSRLAMSRNANDESEVDESMLNTGLFTYPVLQAADILAYKSTHVPVGDDQQQHLELAHDLAESFNRITNSSVFPLPEVVFNPAKRVLSLKDATSKMSKSARDDNSRILLSDSVSTIHSKLRGAVTDSTPTISYDPTSRPGTSNLLTLLAGCLDEDVHVVARKYEGGGLGHRSLKKDVAEVIEGALRRPREELEKLRADPGYLENVARNGAMKAREISSRTLGEIRKLVGLRP